mmetsp:Transcript_6239/g.8434  ORF Transcript_6239/g.8434 Transcript_6239/m.8434 type:complete len:402 (-) Transcript_6239:364-1569(-)|eukprot:CAMPEP_0185728690 /NCGR_PEP_ID=MMETSP1171-20130828/4041_1 /TAXON_ID=374046 /ORGANISM="Helicotheca tamensis, Strain CCMP826" /LENGTH=401 /DNA_ID=CAMNT_0028397423 /DNA_START=37 /DNA_END=1242 /DNA_ORIENTATION=+
MVDDLFSAVALLVGTVGSGFILNFLIKKYSESSFERDATGKTFNSPIAGSASLLHNKDSVLSKEGVNASIDNYESLFSGARKEVGFTSGDKSIETRQKEYKTMVSSFYDLVTDFYEWGWGQSFHFAPRLRGETFNESIKRIEYYLALRANITDKSKVIDVGCGVGGPMRNIQQFTGADITGVTINDYQVRVGNQYCAQKGIADKCRVVQGDFQYLPKKFPEGQFDAAYAIEATCHSPDRIGCFTGVNHCLKKGGIFVGLDWVVLPERGYDAKNPEHVRVKEGIEVGNGLPTLATGDEVVRALEKSGFKVIDAFDANRGVHSPHEIPWYDTLCGSFTLSGFRMTRIGRMCTHTMVTLLEMARIAPRGSVKVSALLNATALDLVEAGQKELFTPSFLFVAEKL